MAAVPRVFVLPRCSVEVFETDPISLTAGDSVWSAKQVDNLRITENYNEIERFSTGIPYPETHHTDERHSIIFEAIWNVEARLARNQAFIMVINFDDATQRGSARSFVNRTYYGVTTSSRDIGSRDANEFGSGNTLKAQYYAEETGDY